MVYHNRTLNSTVFRGDYQVRLSEEGNDPEWDAFVSSLPHGHHVQTSLWAQVKSVLGYRAMRIIIAEDRRIVAGGQLLIRRLLPFVSLAYMPKGPISTCWDPFLIGIVVDELRRVARSKHCIILAIQPANSDPEFEAFLTNHDFRRSWLELAPTATITHDLTQDTQEILGQMKRQTRQNIKRSEREGITTREGTEEDLPAFYQLHLATSQRQGFTPYPEEYFDRMWQIFSKQGSISLVMAEYQGAPVSALLLVSFGNTVIPKNLGWSGEHPKCRPNDAVFWAAIQWAKAHDYQTFDMEGIDREGAELMLSGQPLPEELRCTPDFFKVGYGGTLTLLPQSYYFVPNLLCRWPCNQILSLDGRSPATQEYLERYRRRIG